MARKGPAAMVTRQDPARQERTRTAKAAGRDLTEKQVVRKEARMIRKAAAKAMTRMKWKAPEGADGFAPERMS